MPESDNQQGVFLNPELVAIRLRQTDPIKWAAWQMTMIERPGMTVGETMDDIERVIKIAFQAVIEERDELRSALCIARVNALNHYKMTLRKFAELCGHSPTWISRWTNKDCDANSSGLPNSCEPPDFVD